MDKYLTYKELCLDEPHVKRTMIYTLLKPYLKLFPVEQFFIYPMELMKKDTNNWLNKLYAFLEVPEEIPKSLEDLNKPANPGRYNREDFVPMTDSSKQHLVSLCIHEFEKLSELTGIDFVDIWGLKIYL